MPEIRIDFDRQESYALLAATEALRQLFVTDDGNPLIAEIHPVTSNREYTELKISFTSYDDVRYLRVRVAAGDLWPKTGRLWLKAEEFNISDRYFDFRLFGNPASPRVEFTQRNGDE